MKAAMQLHPGLAGAGELATGLVPAAYGAPNAFKAANLVRKERGLAAAGTYLALPMLSGVTGAAAAQAAEALMEGKPVKLSPSGLATAALLAMACHGVSVKFRDYTPAQLLEIYKRGSSAPNNNPQEVLSKPEFELYRAIQQRLQLIRQTNPDFDPANLDLTARQAYVTQRQKQSASAKEGSQKGEGGANGANGTSGNSGDRGNNTGPANGTGSPAEGVAGAASSASTGSNSRTVEQPIGSYHFGPGDSLSGTSRNGAKSRLELPSEVMQRLRTQGFQLWDRLPLQAQEELTRLYRRKKGAVETYKTEYGTSAPVSPEAKNDPRTWLAESLAHENVKWAYERRAAGVSGSSPSANSQPPSEPSNSKPTAPPTVNPSQTRPAAFAWITRAQPTRNGCELKRTLALDLQIILTKILI